MEVEPHELDDALFHLAKDLERELRTTVGWKSRIESIKQTFHTVLKIQPKRQE